MNYDDTVRLTMQHAQQHGWEVVQDTAWGRLHQNPNLDHGKATQHWQMKPSSKCVKWA
ncbi:putative diaminopropionate ammonia-lyase [Escherichia coli]|uniref:Putative diaminopropionate ammonia-lyase n=1 Tax=Escherichia coli TaxID=562 RepID=A0A3S4JTZ9_ECOLX|nr:putative diaminopropionate ammonia-lyase [Escherichia coli]